MRMRRALTLIELLVVVSIIALLAALLLPAVKQTKASARTIKCMSNQRQLFLGLQFYVEENDNFYPRQGDFCAINTTDFSVHGWSYLLYRHYVRDSAAWVCPSDC